VLGPLEVVREGRRIRPGGKAAALLVALLLRRGEVVPAETLLGELWDDRPPRSAAKLLQAHVSQLRKLLGRQRLQTVGTGYLVAAEPEDVDLGLFELRLGEAERARARGELEAALDALGEGLALWRGPPLANLLDEPYVR